LKCAVVSLYSVIITEYSETTVIITEYSETTVIITEYSETTAHFKGNFDTDNQIYVP
jgi:hypothetical protein